MVKLSVMILSQPKTLVVVCVYIPDAVYVSLFKVKGPQATSFNVDVEKLLMVKFKVNVESQPPTVVRS